MSGGISPEQLALLEATSWVTLINVYSRVAALALQTYEYAITFEDELKYIWLAPWSLIKVLYLFNRYIPFISVSGVVYVLATTPQSEAPSCASRWTIFSSLVFVNYIFLKFTLFIRAIAVWNFRKRVKVAFLVVYLGLGAAAAYVIGMLIKSADSFPRVFGVHILPRGCVLTLFYDFDWVGFIILMALETVSLLLVFLRAVKLEHSPLMKTIYTDGIIYYILITLSTMANILLILIIPAPSPMRFLMLLPQSVYQSILCNRLLIHIRKAIVAPSEVASIFRPTPPPRIVPDPYPLETFKGEPSNTEDSRTPIANRYARPNRPERGFRRLPEAYRNIGTPQLQFSTLEPDPVRDSLGLPAHQQASLNNGYNV